MREVRFACTGAADDIDTMDEQKLQCHFFTQWGKKISYNIKSKISTTAENPEFISIFRL